MQRAENGQLRRREAVLGQVTDELAQLRDAEMQQLLLRQQLAARDAAIARLRSSLLLEEGGGAAGAGRGSVMPADFMLTRQASGSVGSRGGRGGSVVHSMSSLPRIPAHAMPESESDEEDEDEDEAEDEEEEAAVLDAAAGTAGVVRGLDATAAVEAGRVADALATIAVPAEPASSSESEEDEKFDMLAGGGWGVTGTTTDGVGDAGAVRENAHSAASADTASSSSGGSSEGELDEDETQSAAVHPAPAAAAEGADATVPTAGMQRRPARLRRGTVEYAFDAPAEILAARLEVEQEVKLASRVRNKRLSL